MRKVNDFEYYAVRLKSEREAADAATCEAARASHLALAQRYRELLDSFGRPKLVTESTGVEQQKVRRSAGG